VPAEITESSENRYGDCARKVRGGDDPGDGAPRAVQVSGDVFERNGENRVRVARRDETYEAVDEEPSGIVGVRPKSRTKIIEPLQEQRP
jgi:hypothetical protein